MILVHVTLLFSWVAQGKVYVLFFHIIALF